MDLEQLTDAMRKQADGLSHGAKCVWDKDKMTYVMSDEMSDEECQRIKVIATTPFYGGRQ